MTPLLAAAAPAFVINPILGVFVLGSITTLNLILASDGSNDKKNTPPPAPEAPVKKAIKQLQQTETKANNTVQHQKTTVKVAASTVKHDTQRLNQTTAKIERAAQTIETQTEKTQVHIHEMNRLRSSVALTNAALKANQKALEKSETKLGETTHKLLKTQQQLDENVATHQVAASNILKKTIKLHATQTQAITPLLKSKDEEIAGLRSTLRVINSHAITLQKEGVFKSKPNKSTETNLDAYKDNQNKGASHASHKS